VFALATLGESVANANVQADSEVECCELSLTDLARLGESDPRLQSIMYENLARKLASNLHSANAGGRALSG
jgi:CRP-like cAMP-binding protein